jgi:hypothetical protein
MNLQRQMQNQLFDYKRKSGESVKMQRFSLCDVLSLKIRIQTVYMFFYIYYIFFNKNKDLNLYFALQIYADSCRFKTHLE